MLCNHLPLNDIIINILVCCVVAAIISAACRCDVLSLLLFQRVQPALQNKHECCRHGQDYNNHSQHRNGRVQCSVAAVVISLRFAICVVAVITLWSRLCASCKRLNFSLFFWKVHEVSDDGMFTLWTSLTFCSIYLHFSQIARRGTPQSSPFQPVRVTTPHEVVLTGWLSIQLHQFMGVPSTHDHDARQVSQSCAVTPMSTSQLHGCLIRVRPIHLQNRNWEINWKAQDNKWRSIYM